MGMVQGTMAQEPYAVLSEDYQTLTFYYDNNKDSRNGMSIGPFTSDNYTQRWNGHYGDITIVVFDNSMANCNSITSTYVWFFQCYNLKEIRGIVNLNTENVTKMAAMFSYCTSLTSLDLSTFNTENVTGMGDMFSNCTSLVSLNLSGFNTTKVTHMDAMFSGCSSLPQLNISSFNTENVTNMRNMFSGCSNLRTIYASDKWTTNKISSWGGYMFSSCEKLVGGAGTTYDSSRTDYHYAHIDGGAGAPGYFTDITTSNVKTTVSAGGAYNSCYDLSGRRQKKPAKGINIIDGRKVVVK